MRDTIKTIFMILAIISICCFAGGCDNSDECRSIRVGVTHPPDHTFSRALRKFADAFEQRTEGRYKVDIFDSGRLGGETILQEMLTLGTAEITVTGVVNIYEPLFAVFEMPYLYRDRDHVIKVMTGDILKDVAKSLQPLGVRLVGFYENGFRHITNSVKEINTPQDVSGLQIRTPENPAQIETFRALGAKPTPLSFSELYTALLTGAVDGQENPLQNIVSGRLYEVQKYIAMTSHIYNSAYILISERFWQSMSQNDRDILIDCVEKSSVWQLSLMEKIDIELEKRLKEESLEFTYPDRDVFKQASQSAYHVIYQKLGPAARELVVRIQNTE